MAGFIDGFGVEENEVAHRFDLRAHGEEHPTNVGVSNDRIVACAVDRPSLHPSGGMNDAMLVSALCKCQTLLANSQACVVHHDEHGSHAGVQFADQLAECALPIVTESQHAGGRCVNAHLVFGGNHPDVVSLARSAVCGWHELRNDETADSLCTCRCTVDPRQHEMDDVVGHVVFAPRDVDLLAGDPPGAIRGLNCAGSQRTNIATGIGLGEIHGAGPFAGNELTKVRLFLRLRSVCMQSIDCTLCEHWAQGKGHVGRLEQFSHRRTGEMRETATAVFGVERNASPPTLGECLIRRPKSAWRCDRGVGGVDSESFSVAHLVGWRPGVGDETGELIEEPRDRVDIGMFKRGQRRKLVGPDEIEGKPDVAEGSGVLQHGYQSARPASARGSQPLMITAASPRMRRSWRERRQAGTRWGRSHRF